MSHFVIGQSALDVFIISISQFWFFTSRVRPEPKFDTAEFVKFSLKTSKDQNLDSIFANISQLGTVHHGISPSQ